MSASSAALVLFEGVQDDYEVVKDSVEAAVAYFDAVKLLRVITLTLPREAFSEAKGRYDASAILKDLKCRPELSRYACVLSLTDRDIFVPGSEYVFGVAELGGRVMIVSTKRLKSSSEHVFKQRVFKEFLHEIGHLFGLDHCNDPSCVMSFSETVADVDDKSFDFCASCKEKLAGAGAIPPPGSREFPRFSV